MPREIFPKEHARAWLADAARDLFAAKWLLTSPMNLADGIGYHLQQAVEKAEKAFLIWNEIPFEKIHDLAKLGASCADIDSALESPLLAASELTDFAGRGRYGGDQAISTEKK